MGLPGELAVGVKGVESLLGGVGVDGVPSVGSCDVLNDDVGGTPDNVGGGVINDVGLGVGAGVRLVGLGVGFTGERQELRHENMLSTGSRVRFSFSKTQTCCLQQVARTFCHGKLQREVQAHAVVTGCFHFRRSPERA